MMFETIAISILLSNTETWGIIKKKEMEELESIQKEAIMKILRQKVTTSYDGILCELGMWRVKHRINEKRLIYIHNVLTSDDDRQVKKVMKRFIEYRMKNTWSEVVEELEKEYDVRITEKEIKNYSKTEWKKEIRHKIQRKVKEERSDEQKIHTKMRYCDVGNFKTKDYLTKLNTKDALKMLELRLQMNEVKINFKGKYYEQDMKCPLCMKYEDTNNHQIKCEKIKDVKIKNDKEYNQYLQSNNQEEIRQFLTKIRINEELRE